VTEEEIAGIQRWREAPVYGPIERAVLAFGDAMADGAVPTPIWHDLATHFDDAECVELTLTAAFYVMGGRTVAALRIPLDVAPR
jgi:alkylhydroperoxidase family enzyme